MATGIQRATQRDRIIVHAPLDVFTDTGNDFCLQEPQQPSPKKVGTRPRTGRGSPTKIVATRRDEKDIPRYNKLLARVQVGYVSPGVTGHNSNGQKNRITERSVWSTSPQALPSVEISQGLDQIRFLEETAREGSMQQCQQHGTVVNGLSETFARVPSGCDGAWGNGTVRGTYQELGCDTYNCMGVDKNSSAPKGGEHYESDDGWSKDPRQWREVGDGKHGGNFPRCHSEDGFDSYKDAIGAQAFVRHGHNNFNQFGGYHDSHGDGAGPRRTSSKASNHRWEYQSCQTPKCPPESPRGDSNSSKTLVQEKSKPSGRQLHQCRKVATDGDGSMLPAGRSTLTPNAKDAQKQTPESLNEALVRNTSDMLLFSKKARPVEYKPCTLKQYREAKPKGYVELGKLQPDLNTEELIAKRANAERVKEFSANLRQINCETVARRSNPQPAPKTHVQNSRSRALEFARKIPLPHRRRASQPTESSDMTKESGRDDQNARPNGVPKPNKLRELEALEALHDDMRRKVQEERAPFRR